MVESLVKYVSNHIAAQHVDAPWQRLGNRCSVAVFAGAGI